MTLLASLDASTPSAEDLSITADQHLRMHAVLDGLTEREAGIVCMRLGLIDDPDSPQTWDGIGQVYGISGTRASQVFEFALDRIRDAELHLDHSAALTQAVRAFLAA